MPTTDMLVGDLLEAGRANHPGKPAIVADGLSRTYGELADRVHRLAGALEAAGLGPRQRVAVLAANDPGVIEVLLAASLIGAVVLPLNPRVTAKDIAFQVEDAEAEVSYVQAELEPLARAAGLCHNVWFSGDDLDMRIGAAEPYRGARPESDAVLIHLYTSGTTGRPKGCLLTQRGWLSSAAGWAHATAMSHRDVVWPQLPLFHVAGIHFLLTTLATGATFVADGPGDAMSFWSTVRTRSVTITTLFPDPLAIITHAEAAQSSATLRIAFTQKPSATILQALPGVTIGTTYGATELGGMAVSAFADDCFRPGSGAVLGRPLLGMTAAVLDDEDQPVPLNAVGELCFRGAATSPGYWNLPEASAATLRNGWVHTGDLGHVDERGLLFFEDRKKDMVKTGGENVYSIEVESVLQAHEWVAECAVIGVPDDRWGEAVKAVVVTRADVTVEDLDRWCLQRMAAYKRPRWYSFVDQLPRNALAKVAKTELRAVHDVSNSTRIPERS